MYKQFLLFKYIKKFYFKNSNYLFQISFYHKKISQILILYTANWKAKAIVTVASAYIAIIVPQVAVPREIEIVLCWTPPVTVCANAVEIPIVVTKTARKPGKTTRVGAITIILPTTNAFHFYAGSWFSSQIIS